MRLYRPLLLLTAIGLALPACSDSTAPTGRAVTSAVVEHDTLVATPQHFATREVMRFTVPVTIRNGGPDPVDLWHCRWSIVAGAEPSQRVWSPICVMIVISPITIEPGETLHLDLTVSAAFDGPWTPDWNSDQLAGTYRLALGLIPHGAAERIPWVISNEFALVLGPES